MKILGEDNPYLGYNKIFIYLYYSAFVLNIKLILRLICAKFFRLYVIGK